MYQEFSKIVPKDAEVLAGFHAKNVSQDLIIKKPIPALMHEECIPSYNAKAEKFKEIEPQDIVVAFDVDGHLIDTETYAYPAWYQGLLDYYSEDNVARGNVVRLINPETGGKDYFSTHFMGHSHKEINQEINENIAPHNPMSLEEFKKDLLADIDDKIADKVTPDSLFPGIKEMMKDLKKLQDSGEIKMYFVSGSAVKRLRTSFRNSGLDEFIDDFDAQVYSGENYKNKNDVFRQLAKGNPERLIYSGDGFGDAKSCKRVVGDKEVFFIGKSEGSHCTADHYQKLAACGANVMTRNGFELCDALLDRINFLKSKLATETLFSQNIDGTLDVHEPANAKLSKEDVMLISLSQRQNGL